MKRNFQLTLKGGELFPLFYVYLVITIGYQVFSRFLSMKMKVQAIDTGTYLAIFLPGLVLFMVFACVYQILLARLFARKIDLGGQTFEFKASIPKYVGMVLLGVFLSVITLGIYVPWFAAKISRYLAGETSFQQKPFVFHGKGGGLFPVLLFSLAFPLAILIGGGIYLLYHYGYLSAGMKLMTPELKSFLLGHIPAIVAVAAVFILIVAVTCFLVYRWTINGIGRDGVRAKWNTPFFRSVGFILIQVLFTIVTAGIGFPAAILFLYRYFVKRVETVKEGKPAGRFSFDGHIGKGFLLIWGQLLLSIITLGIYGSWAICKVGNYFLTSTSYEAVN